MGSSLRRNTVIALVCTTLYAGVIPPVHALDLPKVADAATQLSAAFGIPLSEEDTAALDQIQYDMEQHVSQVIDEIERNAFNVDAHLQPAPQTQFDPTAQQATPTKEEFRPIVDGPNYHWHYDIGSRVAAQSLDPVLQRVAGSYFNQPDVPPESLRFEAEGISLYGPGTPVYVGDSHLCTIAATGTDEQGRKVAITAGHCGQVGDTVTSADSWRIGASGTVVSRGETLDYSVIELGSNAAITTSYSGISIDGLGGNQAEGTEITCKQGIATGTTCGLTWLANQRTTVTQICAGPGDSGAPVLRDGKVVGVVSGGLFPHTDFACRTPWQGALHAPTVHTNMDAILADINTGNGVGKNFRLTPITQ
ncbi:putative secreted protein [Corynebacterium kutscheri]|uniref:Secreted protein n=1 Tax=Corynebacterium kutscheri TaxID=35755 RepID=A0A0F6TEN7_9CORY|nr:S1 family peptidase [Corynebacterium kutscheri]AKE41924.1 hypothetical protein UL82_08885 [Corynebacterium kutscheri]VEH06449.1 putative secreted protein [Corynebacterium kutscheri]VEH10259.1 putative secreted protein [Corynebacterium kutscheri]VEH82367.1 putative secreted protein [Corynebacterium kutscheri]